MSLRRTVFLAVALAVLATTLVEGVLDVIVDGFATQHRLFFDLIDIPLMLGLAAVIAWLVARRIAKPLRNLSQATRLVAEQTFPAALEVPPGNDELAELAANFNAMTSAVQGFVEREQAFTRYASHELRTPLSAMRLQIERAEMGLVAAHETLPVLRRNVAQLEEIIRALLSLARAPDEEPEHRLLAPLLHDSLANFQATERTRLTFTDGVPANLKVTHARLLQQSLTNLVDNALRHGSGRATVEVQTLGQLVTLRIQDEGPGVEGPELDRMTVPFYRGHEERAGSGLGLSFVAFVAKALGGDLHLDSTSGGLLAVLTLPIVAPT